MKRLNLFGLVVVALALCATPTAFAKSDPPKSMSGGFSSKGSSEKPAAKPTERTAPPPAAKALERVQSAQVGGSADSGRQAGGGAAPTFGTFKSGGVSQPVAGAGAGVVAGAKPGTMAADLKVAADRDLALKTLAQRRVAAAATAAVVATPIAIGAAAVNSHQPATGSATTPVPTYDSERDDYARGYRQATRDVLPQVASPPVVIYRDRSFDGSSPATAAGGFIAGRTVDGSSNRSVVDQDDRDSTSLADTPMAAPDTIPSVPAEAPRHQAVAEASIPWVWIALLTVICGGIVWLLMRSAKPKPISPKRYAL